MVDRGENAAQRACRARHDALQKLADYCRALRVRDWLKNLLLFAPLVAAHKVGDGARLMHAAIAFVAFGLSASSVYVFNDLIDIEQDRRHPRKKDRPFASGRVPVKHGLIAIPLLLVGSFSISLLQLSTRFAFVIALYVLLNLAYSFRLKAIPILDVLLLAGLYTLRIFGGSVVTDIWLSPWLLIFSMFLFFSLALIKRYAELMVMRKVDGENSRARGYRLDDAELLAALGGGAGYLAVLVLAFYIESGAGNNLYGRPSMLWALCVLLLYWISHLWLVAHRQEMEDDPLLFTLRDPVSRVLMILMVLIYISAL